MQLNRMQSSSTNSCTCVQLVSPFTRILPDGHRVWKLSPSFFSKAIKDQAPFSDPLEKKYFPKIVGPGPRGWWHISTLLSNLFFAAPLFSAFASRLPKPFSQPIFLQLLLSLRSPSEPFFSVLVGWSTCSQRRSSVRTSVLRQLKHIVGKASGPRIQRKRSGAELKVSGLGTLVCRRVRSLVSPE